MTDATCPANESTPEDSEDIKHHGSRAAPREGLYERHRGRRRRPCQKAQERRGGLHEAGEGLKEPSRPEDCHAASIATR